MSRKPKSFSESFLDPLVVQDRCGIENHSLRNLLAGGRAFLVCGGPSSKSLPLENLNRRGIWSMAVNNMAGYCRTNAFICADPPSKFHNGIWLDPSVMKFIPLPKLHGNRGNLREKTGEDFKDLYIGEKRIKTPDCPNVWAYGRRSWLVPDDTFFTEKEAAWGNHNEGVARTGLRKSVCTMVLALRVLYYLGARRVHLVGCDWRMTPTAGYAFGQGRDSGAINSNNNLYDTVGEWLCTLESSGILKKYGLEVYNTNQFSGLRAFPYVPFETAISDALKHFPQEPFDLEGWYASSEKSESKK